MIAAGRTLAEARTAGTLYRLEVPGWADAYMPAACESLGEVRDCFVRAFPETARAHAGERWQGWRVVGGSIGGWVVTCAGTVIIVPVAV